VLGSKVVFVALGATVLVAERIPPIMWLAAIITTAGIFLMSATDLKTPRGGHLAGPVVMALISAAFFAVCDVLVQHWAPAFGAKRFLVICTMTTAGLSLLSMLPPGRPRLAWNTAVRWSVGGSVLIAAQAMLVALALATWGDALGVNVVYATRGLWILLIVAVFGPLIGNLERRDSGKAYRIRILAACLLLVGVVCAVMGRM
jgi:drug/metabolite transporter (DMT)-like permease